MAAGSDGVGVQRVLRKLVLQLDDEELAFGSGGAPLHGLGMGQDGGGTRLDTRALRRWYGGEFMDLIDAPVNAGTMVDFVFSIADCLGRHEDRITVTGVRFSQTKQGQLVIIPEGTLTATGKAVVLGAIPVGGAR